VFHRVGPVNAQAGSRTTTLVEAARADLPDRAEYRMKEEASGSDGCQQRFEKATLFWTPQRGVSVR